MYFRYSETIGKPKTSWVSYQLTSFEVLMADTAYTQTWKTHALESPQPVKSTARLFVCLLNIHTVVLISGHSKA